MSIEKFVKLDAAYNELLEAADYDPDGEGVEDSYDAAANAWLNLSEAEQETVSMYTDTSIY